MTIVLIHHRIDPHVWNLTTVDDLQCRVWATFHDDMLYNALDLDIDPGKELRERTNQRLVADHIECVLITKARYNELVAKEDR